MLTSVKPGPVKLPEVPRNSAFDNSGRGDEVNNTRIDFDSLLQNANEDRKTELEVEQAAANGDLNLGETKTDKEFRDMLEKVTGKKQDRAKNALNKDDYLNLMVTQMRYQDPLKPMDNQEMATQLAQFNTVEQLMGVNKILTDMSDSQKARQSDNLTQYLGRAVQVDGNKLKVNPDRAVSEGNFELPIQASVVTVSVINESGQPVRSIPMGTLQAGDHRINWDGKDNSGKDVPDGMYRFEVNANTSEGKPLKPALSYTAFVSGVTDIASGGRLETSVGKVELDEIRRVRIPSQGIEDQKKVSLNSMQEAEPFIKDTENNLNADEASL